MSLITNYYWTFKRGSKGKVLTGNLRDADGPFQITGTLTVKAWKPRSTTNAWDAIACVPDADQVSNKGNFSVTLDDTSASIDAGTYNIEFKHSSGGNDSYWPDDANPNKTYGTLVVTESR